MKTQFKYALFNGLYIRGAAFAIIFVMDIVFVAIGSAGSIPFAAHATFLSLGGIAIAAMLAANIGSDAIMIRRMFASTDAYLTALTPAPRRQTLLANIIIMMIMDLLTMAFVITCITWMSFNYISGNMGRIFWGTVFSDSSHLWYAILIFTALIASYLLFIMIIIFCTAAKKSFLGKLPASGFLAFLLALACFYAASLLQIVILPISSVSVYGILFTITPNSIAAYPILIILIFLEAAGLFVLTSKLIERKIDI